MKTQTQIAVHNKVNRGRSQTAVSRQRKHRQLTDGGAIFFESLYDEIREKSFDEAVCMFKALLGLIAHHPGMESERTALRLIVDGDAQLQNCQAVKRSNAASN